MPADHHALEAPSPWVTRFAGLAAPSGAVLDVACGTGRHTRLFLDRGHSVVGIDRYNAGIVDLLGREDFEFIEKDLEDGGRWPLRDREFAIVVVTNYLHRPLFPFLVDAVGPGGLLVYETFARGNERFGRPRNPDFLLRPGELLGMVEGKLQVLDFEEGEVTTPRPAIVQRIAAINGHSAARAAGGGE